MVGTVSQRMVGHKPPFYAVLGLFNPVMVTGYNTHLNQRISFNLSAIDGASRKYPILNRVLVLMFPPHRGNVLMT